MMPIVAMIFGGELNFTNMFIVLGDIPEGVARNYASLKAAGIPVLAYGNFITVMINFIILAFIIFMMVKFVNSLRRKAEVAPAAAPSEEIMILREISEKLSANRSIK